MLALVYIPSPSLPSWPPPTPKHSNATPNTLFTWVLCPLILCGAILSWLHLVAQLHLPSWLLVPLLCPVFTVLFGGFTYVLFFWFDRFLECILDPRHSRSSSLSLVPDLYAGVWLEYKRRKRRTSGYGPRFIARQFSVPSISFLTQEALTIALVLASWFVFTELPRRNPSKPPEKSHEYLRTEKLLEMAEMGIALPLSLARYAPKTRHTLDYLRLHHHYEQAVHYLIVKPCQFLFDIQRKPKPLSTPAWPAPALDYLLDSGFNQAPPTCYTDDTNQFDATCDPDDAGLPQFFSSVVNTADQHTINLLHFTDEALSLHDAGYRFSFDFTSTAEVPYSSKLPKHWTDFYARMKELEVKASPVSWSTVSSDFLASFSPAEAAKLP